MPRLGIKWEITTEIEALRLLYATFPSLGARVFGHIGKHGRIALKTKYLSGQEINLKGGEAPRDRRGRHMIAHSVLPRGNGVVWRSYPLNLFERVFRPRGVKKAPKKILTGKFAGYMRARLPAMAAYVEQKIIAKELHEV